MKIRFVGRISMWIVIASWIIAGAASTIPMSEGGMAAIACLFMLIVYTGVAGVDVLGTHLALRRGTKWILILSCMLWFPPALLFIGPALMPSLPDCPPMPWLTRLIFITIALLIMSKIIVNILIYRDISKPKT